FFFTIRPTARSTLFPYTTLFRSEVVQCLAAEEQDRQHHHQRAAMGNDRPRQRAGDRAVDDLGHRRLAHLPEILADPVGDHDRFRSEEHTSELQSLAYLVCRLLLE